MQFGLRVQAKIAIKEKPTDFEQQVLETQQQYCKVQHWKAMWHFQKRKKKWHSQTSLKRSRIWYKKFLRYIRKFVISVYSQHCINGKTIPRLLHYNDDSLHLYLQYQGLTARGTVVFCDVVDILRSSQVMRYDADTLTHTHAYTKQKHGHGRVNFAVVAGNWHPSPFHSNSGTRFMWLVFFLPLPNTGPRKTISQTHHVTKERHGSQVRRQQLVEPLKRKYDTAGFWPRRSEKRSRNHKCAARARYVRSTGLASIGTTSESAQVWLLTSAHKVYWALSRTTGDTPQNAWTTVK